MDARVRGAIAFDRDSNYLLVGPTSSGKTQLLKEILESGTFKPQEPKRIFVLAPNETATEWSQEEDIEILSGESALDGFLAHRSKVPENSVVIFDDWMTALDNTQRKKEIEQFFFVTTHHRHLWTFFVTHDMFNKNMVTIRRNTQCYFLFNLFQSDARASQEFLTRLYGSQAGSSIMALWKGAIADDTWGWIRIENKLRKVGGSKSFVSTGGVTFETAWLAARSDGMDGTLYLDVFASHEQGDDPELAIPAELVQTRNTGHGEPTHDNPEDPAGGVPAEWPSDMQQSDGHQPLPE